jgi:putative FmdB family regulatory protein
MPYYDFQCPACGSKVEISRSIKDENTVICTAEVDNKPCGTDMVKLISATSFQLKGGGWFKDGY